ncbi:P1 family peptidase [Agromyces soli]|uniref:P1 family peptidase n=1 Tax=Agromyces soli TaxID=659012 RepID=A0ABY4AUH3_9MICO|nr:P1 family peptidase [Agromyces soli]UOE26660.1 P1 family peptidase [Agromyces soli]
MTYPPRRPAELPRFRGLDGNPQLAPSPVPGTPRELVDHGFAELTVGTAEYAEGPTGVTVMRLPDHARVATDFRGGSKGLSGGYQVVEAICFAGGSVYGFGAATGVAEALLAERDNDVSFPRLSLVNGAIIYDFSARNNAVIPDAALGKAALANAVAGAVPVGRVGAGVSATVGKIDWSRAEFAGQGAAYREISGIKLLVVTVVNAVGAILDREQRVVRGNYDPETGERRHPAEDYAAAFAGAAMPATELGNTTITAVFTNVRLDDRQLDQFAKQVHSSMHRAIQPFHTSQDGDVLFAVTTDELDFPTETSAELGVHQLAPSALGAVASELAWDAVLSAAA